MGFGRVLFSVSLIDAVMNDDEPHAMLAQ